MKIDPLHRPVTGKLTLCGLMLALFLCYFGNLPPVLKIVTCTVCMLRRNGHFVLSNVWFNNFALTTGFYWSYMLLL